MEDKPTHGEVERRNDVFSETLETRIWQEEPSPTNPYVADRVRCQGYALDQLISRRSYPEVLFLLFRGELPGEAETRLLEQLMIALINPGPRHPATRAAIAAGVGKTDRELMLPIALGTLSGTHLGAGEVEPAMRFLRRHRRHDPAEVANEFAGQWSALTDEHPIPGFGSLFGDIDPVCQRHAAQLAGLNGCGALLKWGHQLAEALAAYGAGWLSTGLAAAVLADLGFQPRYGAGLYQLLCAPGLLAHGMEYSNKPITAFPFIPDERYVIEDDEPGAAD